MMKKKPQTVTVRRNGVTKKLHGAAAQAVLRARGKRNKKNGLGSTVKTAVRAVHEAARGVARATVNPSRQRANAAERDAQHPNMVHKYYRGGGTSMRQRATAAGQKWLFENPEHLRMRARKRRNGGDAPAQVETLFEDFQGRPTDGFDLYNAPEWTPGDVAVLGGLNSLHLEGIEKVDFDPAHVVLAADKDGELLVLGAQFDGEVTIPEGEGSYEVIETPAYMPSDVVLIAPIKKIAYETHKDHIGDGGEYCFVHKFGEEGGERPFLALDPDGFPMIIGGDYYITHEGIRD